MRISPPYRRFGSGAPIALLVSIALTLAGCDQVVQTLLGIEYPTGFEASDSDYARVVELSWNAISDTDGEGNERTLESYVLTRDGEMLFPGPGTSTGYIDHGPSGGFEIGRLYRYSVYATFVDGSPTADAEDTGYVMDARAAPIHHVPFTYRYETSPDEQWFAFPAQEGWTYRVYATDDAFPLRLLRSGDLEERNFSERANDSYGPYATFRINKSRDYYLEVTGAGAVSIVHE